MRSRHLFRATLTIAAAVLVAGCSSFRSDSRAAGRKSVPAGSIEGKWEGRWHDAKRPRHGGRLECVLTRTGDNVYRLATRSQWWGIFTSASDAHVVVTPIEPGVFIVQASSDLWLFGGYSMTGRVDGASFRATYAMGGHQGVMELNRPAEGASR